MIHKNNPLNNPYNDDITAEIYHNEIALNISNGHRVVEYIIKSISNESAALNYAKGISQLYIENKEELFHPKNELLKGLTALSKLENVVKSNINFAREIGLDFMNKKFDLIAAYADKVNEFKQSDNKHFDYIKFTEIRDNLSN